MLPAIEPTLAASATAHGHGLDYSIRIPAIDALIKVARNPPNSARMPKLARSDLRFGAMAPMPPSWIPIDEILAKPVSA